MKSTLLEDSAVRSAGGRTRPVAAPAGRSTLFWTFAWFALSFGILMLFWAIRIRPIYVEEQFSELASSARMFHPHFLNWFTKPFSLYRMDYPEWNLLYRSFIRPTECFQYYVLSIFFGAHFSAYLVSNYLYQAGTCALTYFIAAEILKLNPKLCHLLAFMVFISPAYGQQQLFLISFAVDPLAGFLVVASILFFLRRQWVLSWILIALAVGAKEPAWPIPLAMAAILLFALKTPRWQRLLAAGAFVFPVAVIIALRAYAFGMVGALTSDEGGGPSTGIATSAVMRLLQGLEKWPFGVLLHSQQYYPWVLESARVCGYVLDIIAWITVAFYLGRALLHVLRGTRGFGQKIEAIQRALTSIDFTVWATVALAAATLVFPLRFTGDPRYGAPTYPMIFVTLGLFLSRSKVFWGRFVSAALLAGIFLYGFTLRVSDFTYGTDVFHAEWQLVAGYRQAIQNAGSRPMFVVDDATGGEINHEAIQQFYGPQAKVIRINDIYKERDCRILPDDGELPLHIQVTAHRVSPTSIAVRSVMTGCGGHNFLGVPRLPKGPLQRSVLGYKLVYTRLDPRSSPQPASGDPRVLEVTLENVPADTIIVAPDFANRTYVPVPIS